MKEIMGENLSPFFRKVGIYPPKKFNGNVGHWPNLEVWHLTDSQFELIEDMTDEEFNNMAPDGCWWRFAEGSIMDVPNVRAKINDKEILAWANPNTTHNLEYDNLLEYYREVLGVSTEKNICALSVDLAKYNNMTIAELFWRYSGGRNMTLRGVNICRK